ncbi:hypothetical protein ACU60U_04305 [Klebsiella aerogenes]
MTDITKLAQREKFEAWVMTQICISKSTLEGLRSADGYRNSTLSGTNYNRMWNCWKAAGAEMVEALEKAQKSNEFLKGQLSELANFNPDWDKLEASYESWREIAAELLVAKERISELESRTVTVKLPQAVSAGGQGYQEKVERILTAAGIKVEAE